jgi:N-formylglutamate amidohydrolase
VAIVIVAENQGPATEGSSGVRPHPARLERPKELKGGVVIACPHSGRFYPPELVEASILDMSTLRRSEDAFVDLLFQDAPRQGAFLLVNEFGRAFVDVNRDPSELDPQLIAGLSVSGQAASSDRVKAGLGVIPRTVGDGVGIYSSVISLCEANARMDEVHRPWHAALEQCLGHLRQSNGAAVLLDCHSMPGHAAGSPPFDVILGDRFGVSCAPVIMNEVAAFFKAKGLKVARNNPYAGGYTTRRHGRTMAHDHALQIEINRSLYMVEGAMTLRPGFASVREVMSDLVRYMVDLSLSLRR